MSKDIYVYIEQRDCQIEKGSIELIGEAKKLAKELDYKVVGVIIGNGVSKVANEVIEYGADEVIVIDAPVFENYTTEPYTKAMVYVINERHPDIILVSASSLGRDLAPRISARVHTGLTADCTQLEIDPEKKILLMTRPAFGGNIMATIICENNRPQIATVRGGVMQALDKDPARTGVITNMDTGVTEADLNVEVLEVIKSVRDKVDISAAEIIVSGGRGVGSTEGFKLLEDVANILGGVVAGSRGAVDEGWVSKPQQVGQTGTTVRPKLYIACGISGAIQHIAGMEGSEYIIAINKDPGAEIFKYANVGIVGDVKKVLPLLAKELEACK
ncbi:electron transfer flavoprotein subunit alpha [Candidatus Epulonipiscium fishelsonii]|uniref:Electron transfer flavoprotein subunit alpha n=1 Tax=Candidatus Epulonipiscium fishelsonii TaxID=77094 RepID=A0ACC8XBS0_9FIRM|nr:electron transfer flavoprotein subunit alpha [Epulopiscium sp. SCG-B05WGA-EpuloA1]ONI39872.1 electron transfer flavoprotein subunit alpha [Epulopiscium sp. SCG-B11WGA-EpuloA1]